MAQQTLPFLPTTEKRTGYVVTPQVIADALCEWAVRRPTDSVLDLGVGEGAFALSAVSRLRDLGAPHAGAAQQVWGSELDPDLFRRVQEAAVARFGRPLIHVDRADFYSSRLPEVDAVVGNPPYIRRHYQNDGVVAPGSRAGAPPNGLTDAYCHFLLKACAALRDGGRLAVIVSASWLDMKYGRRLKEVLTSQFRLQLLLTFNGKVFGNALVKPVVILAEKAASPGLVTFAHLDECAPLESIRDRLIDPLDRGAPVEPVVARIQQDQLSVVSLWSLYFKSPSTVEDLRRAGQLQPLRWVARSRIGLQTFAKGFYILTRDQAVRLGIEERFLLPLAVSPRYVRSAVINGEQDCDHVLFSCDLSREALAGTGAGDYVERAMHIPVPVRGKGTVVLGFQSAPRLARAAREPWYNIRSAIRQRGTYPILIPRRVFHSYNVIHNQAGVIVNEDFIEVQPFIDNHVDPLLAFLSSSFGELLVRSHSFQYGGGVFNLNPGRVPDLPVIDTHRLSVGELVGLTAAWQQYAEGPRSAVARRELDCQVARLLSISGQLCADVDRALTELVRSVRAAGTAHRDS